MSIGANWRQISPGNVPGVAGDGAGSKFAQSNAADQLSETSEGRGFSEYMFGQDGFEFSDVLDVINPLQHIPGVGMIYRSLTGDELGNGARVVGGGLFGGVFGLAGAAIDAVVDAVTGEDTGAHVMAFVEDSFGGGDENGTAIADASENSSDSEMSIAAADGSYQGDLVLPWMTGSQSTRPSRQAAPQAEQETIVQNAPVAPVDQTVLASNATVNPVRDGIKASDLNVPWAQSNRPAQSMNPQLQAQMTANMTGPTRTNDTVTPAAPATDPAELTVAMASAQTGNPASSGLAQTVAANSASHETMRRPILTSDGGNTVWARAQSSGRVSRQGSSFAISPEMAAHEARTAKLNTAKENVSASKSENAFHDGNTPLSAAEMAARFNAALGRDKAQTMAADAVASTNAVADQDQSFSQNARNSGDVSANTAGDVAPNSDAESHPLMQRASNHLGGDEPVGAWFSQTMMDGLKKYQAMQQQNQARPSGNAI